MIYLGEAKRVLPKDIKRRAYSVIVENEPGVLARIAGLFSARGFNIASLSVGETLDPNVSRMTIVAEGTDVQLEQINKQLNKIVPVISVRSLMAGEYVARELLLVKIDKSDKAKKHIKDSAAKHEWHIVDESPEHFIVQAVVKESDVKSAIEELKKFGATELARTGQIAMSKKYKI